MPKPGINELMKGEAMAVNLKVQGRNGGAASLKALKFEIGLTGTSSEPGTTINYPFESHHNLPDLRLLPAINVENPDRGQSMELECTDGSTGQFFIGSYDGGGWTDLKVVAILEHGIQIEGHLFNPSGVVTIPVPKRKAGSNIADAWLQLYGNPGDRDDKEQLKGNPNLGDGLSAYEEYRGVISETVFKRLDPQKHEAGVWMKKDDIPYFAEGLKWLEAAMGIKVIRFVDNEINAGREFNINNKTANTYLQYVQKLEKGNVLDGIGENVPFELTVKTPKESQKVVIDSAKISQNYRDQRNALLAANARYHFNLQMPYTESEQIANTVAHELAHGLDVDHHGHLSPPLDSARIPEGGLIVYHIYPLLPRGTEITERPYIIRGNIGTMRNDESGDLSCIMAYTSYYQWVKRVEMNGDINYYEVGLLPYGRKLCNTKNEPVSTRINYNDKYFGSAEFGECLQQVRFK
jgi:hypothetical protein